MYGPATYRRKRPGATTAWCFASKGAASNSTSKRLRHCVKAAANREKPHCTAKDAKSTKFKSISIRALLGLRDLRGEKVFRLILNGHRSERRSTMKQLTAN